MELNPYHDEANDWLRGRGWLSRRSDESWRDCFADDWKWFGVPDGYQPTTIIFTGADFTVDYAYDTADILQQRTYRDSFCNLEELKRHIGMIEAWPQEN
ncbi:hypothetical protein ICM05_12540 [Leucobacter sp. cx-42]|uniref:hypothetical protein n=1 Tax=unclassified Leucobacter TaxID=2621730 RepID=UPI00165D9EA5|nr:MULTISPECIES: hypothetical protein [unclassified Leucobacter]MBC9955443.1 hypothetical protein [Leucobacter sp. cx-42]